MTQKTTRSSKVSRVGTHVDVKEVLPTLENAYLLVLQIPFGSLRIRNQAVFSELRDTIAKLTGQTPQEVQECFEDRASDRQEP